MYCPIQGYRKQYQNAVSCFENECAWWDKVRKQCMVKSVMEAHTQNLPTPMEAWQQEQPHKSALGDFAEYLKGEDDLW